MYFGPAHPPGNLCSREQRRDMEVGAVKSSGLGEVVDRVMKVSQVGPNKFYYEFETKTKDGKVERSTDDRICDGKEHTSVVDGLVTTRARSAIAFSSGTGNVTSNILARTPPDGKTLANSIKRWDKDGKPLPDALNFFQRQ
jgi:hypothetical protein